MIRIDVDVITLPYDWANALINDCYDGLDANEIALYEDYMEQYYSKGWYVVSVAYDEDGEPQEPRFTNSFDLYGGSCRAGMVIDFIIHKEMELVH